MNYNGTPSTYVSTSITSIFGSKVQGYENFEIEEFRV